MKPPDLITWRDLLHYLQNCPSDRLDQDIQAVCCHPDEGRVNELMMGISIGTVEEFEILYARSSRDNRHHGEEMVLLLDRNPHSINGAIAYELFPEKPIFPPGHDESADWTNHNK